MQTLLQLKNVDISYENREVLHNISFSVQPGEILGIVGVSGCGKSTLLRSILRLDGPAVTGGSILFEDQDLASLDALSMRELRGSRISMVFQEAASHTNPLKTVGSTVFESMRAHRKISKEESYDRAARIFESLSLTDSKRILDAYPFQLSGGMNQRVGIGLAMLNRPSLLLADEPTSALDAVVAVQIIEELKSLRQKYQTAIIIVTHNIKIAKNMTDNILVLNNGHIADYGNTKKVLENPSDEFTKELILACPGL